MNDFIKMASCIVPGLLLLNCPIPFDRSVIIVPADLIHSTHVRRVYFENGIVFCGLYANIFVST